MTTEFDGDDIIVRNVLVTCFGGAHDLGDDGQTESGVMNDGRDPDLMGCALPVRSTEKATSPSPFANPNKPHIPWRTPVKFWRGGEEPADSQCFPNVALESAFGIITRLIDNGPDVQHYPTHWGDLTEAAASFFAPHLPREILANKWSDVLSYRIIGGKPYI